MRESTSRTAALFDGRRALSLLLRRGWVVVLLFVLGVAAGLFYQRHTPPTYTSAAQVQVGYTAADSIIEGQNLPNVDPATLQATQVGVLSSPALRNAVSRRLGHRPSVTVAPVSNSQLIAVTASASSAQRAARDANAYVDIYLAESKRSTIAELNSLKSHLTSTIKAEQRQLSNAPKSQLNSPNSRLTGVRAQLASNSSDLAVVESALTTAPTGVARASTAQPPATPSGLSSSDLALIGGAFGFVIAIALVLFLGSRDDSVDAETDIEEVSGLPVLAGLREDVRLENGDGALAAAQIVHQLPRGGGMVVLSDVTSKAVSHSAARKIAQAVDAAAQSVVAVDVESRAILYSNSEQRAAVDALQRTFPPLPELIGKLRSAFDVVLLSTRPLHATAEATEAAILCDAVVLVVPRARVSAGALDTAVQRLRRLGSHVIGVVIIGGSRTASPVRRKHAHENESAPNLAGASSSPPT